MAAISSTVHRECGWGDSLLLARGLLTEPTHCRDHHGVLSRGHVVRPQPDKFIHREFAVSQEVVRGADFKCVRLSDPGNPIRAQIKTRPERRPGWKGECGPR